MVVKKATSNWSSRRTAGRSLVWGYLRSAARTLGAQAALPLWRGRGGDVVEIMHFKICRFLAELNLLVGGGEGFGDVGPKHLLNWRFNSQNGTRSLFPGQDFRGRKGRRFLSGRNSKRREVSGSKRKIRAGYGQAPLLGSPLSGIAERKLRGSPLWPLSPTRSAAIHT